MSFQETVNSLINDGYECALTMEKCTIFAESVIREYDINCEEAELKVLKESGTDEDFRYLCEAAKEGLVVKLKKAIKKMIQALKDYISNVVDKIKVTYGSKKSRDALDKLEKATKTNPKLKSMKITVHDGEKDEKIITEAIDKLNAQEAKLKGGDSTETIAKTIDDIKEQTTKKRQKIAAAATLTLTLGAAVVLIKKYINKIDNERAEAFEQTRKLVDNMEDFDPEDNRVCQTIYNARSSKIVLLREKIASHVSFIKDLFAGAKGKTQVPNYEESVNDTVDDTVYSESSDEDIYIPATTVDETVEESVGTEMHINESYIDEMFSDIENSVTTESEDDTTETDDVDDVSYESTLDAYLDHLVESTDSDDEETTTESSVSDLDAMLDDISSGLTTESEDVDLDTMLDDITSDITTESSDSDIDTLLDELMSTI